MPLEIPFRRLILALAARAVNRKPVEKSRNRRKRQSEQWQTWPALGEGGRRHIHKGADAARRLLPVGKFRGSGVCRLQARVLSLLAMFTLLE